MDKLKEVEELVRGALAAAVEKGYAPTRHVTVDQEGKRCCALGAFAIQHDYIGKNGDGYFWYVTELLGTSGNEVSDIADGFDKNSDVQVIGRNEYVLLGFRLGKEFVK